MKFVYNYQIWGIVVSSAGEAGGALTESES